MSNYSSKNRLLALEKELYKWKLALQNEQVSPQELESEGTLETIQENADDIEQHEAQESSALLNNTYIEEFVKMHNLSYTGLASVLSNNASQRFKRNIAKLHTQEDDLAPLVTTIPSKLPTVEQSKPKSTFELPDIELAEADSTEFSFAGTDVSDSEPSYSSLFQTLQEARLNKFADSESDETENKV